MTTNYELPDDCFTALMELRRLYPDELSDEPKKKSPSRQSRRPSLNDTEIKEILTAAENFERTWMPIDQAIKTVLAYGWPQMTDEEIKDLYSDSKARQGNTAPLYPACEVTDVKEQRRIKQLEWQADYERRQGNPSGPTLVQNREDLFKQWIARLNLYATRGGYEAIYNTKLRNPCFNFEKLSPEQVVELMRQSPNIPKDKDGHPIEIPLHFLDRVIGETLMYFIFPNQVKDMCEVTVVVSLDMPPLERNKAIDDIIQYWRNLRKEAGYIFEPRNTRDGKRKELAGLADRIKVLRDSIRPPEERSTPRQLPHKSPGDDRGAPSEIPSQILFKHFKDQLAQHKIPSEFHKELEAVLSASLKLAADDRR